MRALLLNLMVAAIWLLLQSPPSLLGFAVGYALGFGLLALFHQVVDSRDYVRRTVALVAFLGLFGREFLRSCLQLLRAALFTPVSRLRPRFIDYDVTGLSRMEVLLLSHCISLTPGTNTVDILGDFTGLRLHVLDCPDPERIRAGIDRTLRRGILAFTR